MSGNADLAKRAREQASQAESGSLDRRAYGCAAVALATTRSLTAARQALAGVHPPELATMARKYLDELARDAV